jgi:predicted O-linked N-acetylglucosamine transferase (SPINDLY family)
LGLAYQANNDRSGAIVAYETAVKLKSNLWVALNNLGVLYRQNEEYEKAINVLNQATKISPKNSIAYDNLGLVYQSKEEYDRAIFYHKEAIKLNPKDHQAYNNLGNAYQGLNEVDKAIECYLQTIKINPNFCEVYLNFGNALCNRGRFREAIPYFKKGLECRPQWIETITALGNAYRDLGLGNEAIKYYQQALTINPNHAPALWNYHLMLPVIYRNLDEVIEWRNRFTNGLLTISKWVESADAKVALQGLSSISTFYLQYQGQNDRDLQQQFGQLSTKIMSVNYPQWSYNKSQQNVRNRKLKVGFTSTFFKEHTIAKLFQGWIEYLDPNYFDVYVYFTGKKSDRFTTQIASYCQHFYHIFTSIEAVVQQILRDNLDILIFTDVGMSPTVDRIAALRLSPVQCLAWGHPITSGLSTIDFFLSSELMEPPEGADHYTEKLVLLPGIGITYKTPILPDAPKQRSEFNLAIDDVVYLSCQSLYKYLPQFDFVFPAIAQKVKRSKFVFIESLHSEEITEMFKARLADAFHAYYLNCEDHCLFVQRLTPNDYLSLNLASDIYLDTIEWSGGNTTLEAIACNLPIVTTPGQFMRGRHSFAMLKQMEITETIGDNLTNYIDIAVRLGNDQQWRQEVRDKIKQRHHLIFNDKKPTEFLGNFLMGVMNSSVS